MQPKPIINATVLMSSAKYFNNGSAINSYMDSAQAVDAHKAQAEHNQIKKALQQAGVEVHTTTAPKDCQDGVYTANWGLCRGNKVILSSLPAARQAEQPHALQALKKLGKKTYQTPDNLRFSGQGDALPCGDLLFCGSGYRTDPAAHDFIQKTLGYQVISLQTVPELDPNGQPKTNQSSGWPDSFFYDIDLALSVITPDLIAWCPDAFTDESQDKIAKLNIKKLEVTLEEAMYGFACNLISTGHTVVMSPDAPLLQSAIQLYGLKTITPQVTELKKGGGYIRCTTLTLDNN